MSTNTLIDTFRERFEAVRGHVHIVENAETAASVILDILTAEKAWKVATAQLPQTLQETLENKCKTAEIDIDKPPYSFEDLPDIIDRVDVGIVGADFAVAESGTLAEIALDDATRLTSSLPRVYIGVTHANDLIGTLMEAPPKMREVFLQNDKNCVISFISGPSRTADIEMRLTLGVHGPEIAHAVMITGDVE